MNKHAATINRYYVLFKFNLDYHFSNSRFKIFIEISYFWMFAISLQPFNNKTENNQKSSATSQCCIGRVIPLSDICCLNGKVVPSDHLCNCLPPIKWSKEWFYRWNQETHDQFGISLKISTFIQIQIDQSFYLNDYEPHESW